MPDWKSSCLCLPGFYLGLALFTFTGDAVAQNPPAAADLLELPLEELMAMDVAVTTAAKRPQAFFDTPAAISVLTAGDLRRSGVTHIADALRLLPGVQVARISASEWAVSVRGLNGRFARYLQVLLDGRSLYTPMFSGVNWDELDLAIEDVERIEVVRGPGGTLWGANAVNGVINIVTKPAHADGARIVAGAGDRGRHVLSGQWGGQHGTVKYRLSASDKREPGLQGEDSGLREDDWRSQRLAGRLDWSGEGHRFSLSLAALHSQDSPYFADLRPASVQASNATALLPINQEKQGYSFQGTWLSELTDVDSLALRLSYDWTERESDAVDWETSNADLDIEWRRQQGAHDLTLGLNSRSSRSRAEGVGGYPIVIVPEQGELNTMSFFGQDQWRLHPDWDLVFGLRYDNQSEAQDHWQYHWRGLWRASERQRWWLATSRARGTPSRIATDPSEIGFAQTQAEPFPGVMVPARILSVNQENVLSSADLRAYELGYRFGGDRLTADLTVFHHRYDNLLAAEFIGLRMQPGHVDILTRFDTLDDVRAEGAEWAFSWRFAERWLLQYNGSVINYRNDSVDSGLGALRASAAASAEVPSNQHALRLLGQVGGVQATLTVRRIAALDSVDIDAYTALDATLEWQPVPGWRVALIGRNLIESDHVEAEREAFFADRFEVEPSVLLRLEWRQ